MVVPARDKLRFDYCDVSEDSRAWQECELDEELEHDLILTGFRPIGCVQAVLRLNGATLIDQVWFGEGGRVMVCVGSEQAHLSTLFEDGTIVNTHTSFPNAWMTATRWNLRMHPRDRHDHAFVVGRMVPVLARHLERVARVEPTSPVVVARTMRDYFAVRLRAAELRDARMHTQLWLTFLLPFVLSAIPALVIIVIVRPHRGALPLAVIAAFIALVPLVALTRNFVAPYLMRLRPGPPPRPAAELLALADDVPRGPLSSKSP